MVNTKIVNILTTVVLVATVVIALYIMAFGLGLSDKLDFGAGAYFYADIPNYNEEIAPVTYQQGFAQRLQHVPHWLYYVLFFAWGYLMWRLWLWIDKRKK